MGARLGRRPAIFLTPRLPWPLDDGGRIVSWQSVWAAAQAWDVRLITFVAAGTETEPLPPAFAEIGVKVERVPHRPGALPAVVARGILGRWPYTLTRYRSAAFERALRDRLESWNPAYVFANHLHMATYVDLLDRTPMILREHNVEHAWMASYAREQGLSPVGLYAKTQAARLRRAERGLCRAAALTLTIQERETESLRALVPGARIETLPVGVDLTRYGPRQPADPPIALLAASFAWKPNLDGALRFIREGWPLVRAEFPAARLRVAGKGQPAALLEASRRAGAETILDVPSMAEEFARAAMLLVPLWVGAGARVKIVEALAASLPVVSTPAGAEGLGLTPGTHYSEGGTPGALADATLALLRDASRGEALARSGRAFAEARWSLPAVARLQNELISKVIP